MSNDEIRVIGSSGTKINSDFLEEGLDRAEIKDKKQEKFFDFYDKNDDEKLDSDEMKAMFSDIQLSAKGSDVDEVKKKYSKLELNEVCEDISRDNVFEPVEIRKYLESKGLLKKVSVGDVLNFLNLIQVEGMTKQLYKDIDAFTTKSRTRDDLKDIAPENMAAILSSYKEEYGTSMLQAIAEKSGAWGSTREEYMNIIRDKLIEQAKLLGVDSEEFEKLFNTEIASMDMTWFSESDTTKLDEIVNGLVSKLSAKQKLYNENKNGILMMMSDIDICWSGEDKNRLVNDIMEYSQKNNPKDNIVNMAKNAKSPKIKQAAKKLIDSKFLDYFPIYVGSIIAQESQYREFEEDVFSKNGAGLMQVTGTIINDMYQSPGIFDDGFIERTQSKYGTAEELVDAVRSREDSEVNLDTGTAGLSGKLDRLMKKINNGTTEKGVKMVYPEYILQHLAMDYNGNDDVKRDKKFGDAKSQVRYVYGREVILRFKRYTPAGVSVNHFFEYNPKTKKMINH